MRVLQWNWAARRGAVLKWADWAAVRRPHQQWPAFRDIGSMAAPEAITNDSHGWKIGGVPFTPSLGAARFKASIRSMELRDSQLPLTWHVLPYPCPFLNAKNTPPLKVSYDCIVPYLCFFRLIRVSTISNRNLPCSVSSKPAGANLLFVHKSPVECDPKPLSIVEIYFES